MPKSAFVACLVLAAGFAIGASAEELPDSMRIVEGHVMPAAAGSTGAFTLQNNTAESFKVVIVTCALLDPSGKPIDVADSYVDNVASGQVVYGSAAFPHAGLTGQLSCRIADVRR